MSKLVDSGIYDHAEEVARADFQHATEADVRVLAEAFQRAYEEWASDMDEKTEADDTLKL